VMQAGKGEIGESGAKPVVGFARGHKLMAIR
jgi:hypothetical protein